MAHDTAPDLAQIQLVRSAFLDCMIAIEDGIPFTFGQVAGFANLPVTAVSFFNLDSKEVGFNLRVHTVALDANEQELSAKGFFQLHFTFRVSNLSDLLFVPADQPEADAKPNLPLTASLLGVAYSTARGMILPKVADTALSGFSLPLRSVQQIMADSAAQDAASAAEASPPLPANPKLAKRKRKA